MHSEKLKKIVNILSFKRNSKMCLHRNHAVDNKMYS